VGLLADEPSLEPRDIVVMCPDIETYAPLIAASFGLDDGEHEAEHPGHRLRVRLADRSLRQVNPLLATVSRLVSLADSRMEASALLDFCATPPVARKFGFSTEDLDRLRDLVRRAGVRWGLDAEHRAGFGMADFRQNTWTAGLDRLLLGIAMDETEERFIGTALPLDDVDSSDVDLVGRLAECVDRIRSVTDGLAVRQPLPAWCEGFKQAVELLTAVAPAESWQVTHAYSEISALAATASGQAAAEVELGLAEVVALLTDAFRGRASRANFRTGTLTICTMLPMRSIPHRVVCLLGVDDGIFPRRRQPDGDDILSLDPWIGDRDPRSEDRQLLLDAIMAARDHLLIVYAGLDPRTGARRPPAVPIGELLDSLDLTARTEDGAPVRRAITTEHPLQPFDARNFAPTADGRPFSFDQASWRGAKSAAAPRREPRPTYGRGPLPVPEPAVSVELADLIRFFNHPVRALLRDRAGLSVGEEAERPVEQVPVDLVGLDHWAVGDRLLRRALAGVELQQLVGAEWRRGRLPPRRLGQVAIDKVADTVRELQETARPYLTEPAERRDVAIELGDLLLSGTVSRLHGPNLVRVGFSRLNARHRLQAWIELLALTATHSEVEWRAVALGRGGHALLGPVAGDWAARVLADLVDLRSTGLCEPLPFAPRTAYDYALLRADDKTVELFKPKLEATWAAERDVAYETFFGARASLDDLLRQPSVAAEARGDIGEPSRFGTLARRVFHPLISAETAG
jgi:exodeoxyribonuclease V gamma subunit